MKKTFLTISALAFAFLLNTTGVLAETQDELFSTKGTLTQVDTVGKMLRVKIEGGLELSFRVEDATQIMVGETPKTLVDLGVNDSVEIQYFYNQNYEKVAKTIKKPVAGSVPPGPTSSYKTQAPST